MLLTYLYHTLKNTKDLQDNINIKKTTKDKTLPLIVICCILVSMILLNKQKLIMIIIKTVCYVRT